MTAFKTVDWCDAEQAVIMLDQQQLPLQEYYAHYKTVEEVAHAIRTLVVRGAPAIGVSGALGVLLGSVTCEAQELGAFKKEIDHVCDRLAETRPTAVNLCWAINRMRAVLDAPYDALDQVKAALKHEALTILADDERINRALGAHGASLIQEGDTVLTHCNAGALATAGHGTALGVLYSAWEAGTRFSVIADETRPVLQGARLTAWELMRFGIPTTLITDNMAASLMAKGLIQKVIVGADRIAANGDVANKIGTYGVAVLAHHHRIPFYVAAPMSTIDPHTPTGAHIPIEERNPREVTHIGDQQVAPLGVSVYNPAFDVTPASFVSAIITERGVFRAPYAFTSR